MRLESGYLHGHHLGVVGPQICLNIETKLTHSYHASPQTLDFYRDHGVVNKWLRVSEESNASNPDGKVGGGKGVFATCNIPDRTRICPYVGAQTCSPCDVDERCQYCLQLYKGCIVCARNTLLDIGYLAKGDTERSGGTLCTLAAPAPPNYGRYFNTLLGERDELEFNCMFEIVDDGYDAMFIHTTRDIVAGEELLIDYGNLFTIYDPYFTDPDVKL